MEKENTIYVAGGETLIGAALLRQLERQGFHHLVGKPGEGPELKDENAVGDFFNQIRPEYVFMAGGKSGGIQANQQFPAELMLDNLLATCHIFHHARRSGVKKLLYLASSCSYPRDCPQPMQTQSLLTAPLEPTNEAYAVAKIAGIKLCKAYRRQYAAHFISAIPANAFGPGDDFRPENSHVIAGLIDRMHAAKELNTPRVEIWGSGNPRREFIYADDLADACVFVMQRYSEPEPINLGGGTDIPIRELAMMIREVVGYSGDLRFDSTKPDGMPSKLLDSTKLLALGWKPATPFRVALEATYDWYRQHVIQATPLFSGIN